MRRLLYLVPLAAAPLLMGAGADPVATVALHLAIILVAARVGGEVAVRLGQPAVLGELLVGVALGNAALLGVGVFEPIKSDAAVDMLARLGVLVLLFEVGLESTVRQMLKVGWTALAVALIGVAAPFALGWGVGAWLLPDASGYVHAFLGATLCATSVGITARVLKDLDLSASPEARVILGAAVIDDVLGLVVLAVVTGVIVAADAGSSLGFGAIGAMVGKSALFLFASIAVGVLVAPRMFELASRLRARGALLATGLSSCFLLAWLAGVIGLAPIIGAFAAGLVFEDLHYKEFKGRGEHGLEELVHPIASFLVPVFFVLMGMQTDLRSFVEPGVLGLAGALTVAAVIGKQACSLGVLTPGVDRIAVGVGMVPRGEVGLIFANIGLGLVIAGERIIGPDVYSAVVVMVIVTTMMTPPALKWSFARSAARRGGAGPGA